MKNFTLPLCALAYSFNVLGQCDYKISHGSGTQKISNTDVTVKTDNVGSWNACNSGPYWVGSATKGGSLTLKFKPAVGSVTINYTSINVSTTSGIEEVVHYVNGNHYPITKVGNVSCKTLAELTPQGNITGSSPTTEYGWDSTVIEGKIDSITIEDVPISGSPYGVIIGVKFCDMINTTSVLKNNTPQKLNVYPNPTTGIFTIKNDNVPLKGMVEVTNILGKTVLRQSNNMKQIDLTSQSKGIYFVKVLNAKNELVATSKIIKK